MLKKQELIKYSKKYKNFKDNQIMRASEFITENIFFAYTEKQFNEEITERKYDVENIVDLGNGSYCHEKNYEKTVKFFQKLGEEENNYFKEAMDFYGALYYSLCDTEYQYTQDIVEALLYLNFKDDVLSDYPKYNEVVNIYMQNYLIE